MRIQLSNIALLFALSITVIASCSGFADTCEGRGTSCSDGASAGSGGAGTSGTGGTGGDSGNGGSGLGGTSGGDAGMQGGEPNGGSAGTSSLPCDGACGSSKPFCKQSTDTCVECLKDGDCDNQLKPFCDTTANECVACLDNEDCDDPTASKCEAGQCVGCGEKADCSHISGKTACDTSASECVECTGSDYSACGESEGTPLVCDSLSRTCSDKKEHTAGLCIPCVSDANCKLGQMCVLQKFGTPAEDVGHFCFWKQGGGSGAPTDCPTQGRPYIKLVEDAVSIDGTTADICGLRQSTCPARSEFSMKDCTTVALPDDSKCSFDPPNDSKCVQFGAGVYRCTMTCQSADDCPGTDPAACDTGEDPPVCKL